MSHVDEGTLHALVDNELPDDERAAVEAHLASCGDCARRFAEATAMARQVHTLLGALDEAPSAVRVEKPSVVRAEAPAALRTTLEAPTPVRNAALASINLTPMQRRMRVLRRVALAASVLLVAGISYRVGVNRTMQAPEKAAQPQSVAIRPVMPAASVVEAAPEAIAPPSAPTVRVATPSGPRAEADVAVHDSAAVVRVPAPAVAAVPPVVRELPKAVAAAEMTDAAADRAGVAVESQRTRSEGAVAMRRATQASQAPQNAQVANQVTPLSQVVVTQVPSAPPAAPAAAGMSVAAAAKAMPAGLSGYQVVDEVSAPSLTRRRYIASQGGAMLTLVMAPEESDPSKPVAKSSDFTVSSSKDGSTVRWHRNGVSYELRGPLAPDSLVKLATQLK